MSLVKKKPLPLAQQEPNELAAQFCSFYQANYRSLRRYVARLSGEPDEAEDVTQEAFVRLWKEMENGARLLNARAWIYRVASNLVINNFKSRSQARNHKAQEEAKAKQLRQVPADIERAAIRRQIVRRALKRLPEPMHQCLLLYHEGLTGREIAEILGVKPSYVGTLVVRAHERFRQECQRLGDCYDLLG